MFYEKSRQKFNIEEFRNPSSEYRGVPFWSWNNKLDKKELLWQIEELKKLGYGGFFMHVRIGMGTEYLGDEFMDVVKACVDKAKEEKMLAWLYDEDRWPSGAAGGLVTKNEKYRVRHLLLTRKPYGPPGSFVPGKLFRRSKGRTENGKLAACFDVILDSAGDLESYRLIAETEEAKGIKLYAYSETELPSPWFNNQTYLNTIDPESVREFIRVTYERYGRYLKNDMGKTVPAIFTDEPNYSPMETLNFAQEESDVTLPWTFDIEETYSKAYGGESLINGIPELLWDLKGGKVSLVRYHYHDHVAELFSKVYSRQCAGWCSKNNFMLTGHLLGEETLESQTVCLGEAMRSYPEFQLPGMDILCDKREYTTAKQVQSVVRQEGKPGMLSELYGVTNWDYDFRNHKLQGDWQAVLGVTVRCPHLSWVSMNGGAKRDYPGTFNYQAPWYKEYPYVEDHFARVAAVMTRGRAIARVGVIHPVESYWLHWGAKENTQAVREQMDRNFQNLCEWLLRGLVDYDYISESLLPSQCPQESINSPVFPVGKMKYDVILVPAIETLRNTTLKRLEAFRKAGGRIIFLGEPPKYTDAIPGGEGQKLWEKSERIVFGREAVMDALKELRDIDIQSQSGVRTNDLFYQLREDEDCRWLFIAHADNPVNPDLPAGELIRISIKGLWGATLYNTLTGETESLPVKHGKGWTLINRPLYEHDSLLIKLDNSKPLFQDTIPILVTSTTGYNGRTTLPLIPPCTSFLDPVPVTLHEPNVLLLDIAEFALDKDAYRPREEILRIDNVLRNELGWPLRGDVFAQPWVEQDTSTPHTLRLRYSFNSEVEISGCELGLENAASAEVLLNGEKADPVSLWYVDKCIGKVKLPGIKTGRNVLEIFMPYGRKVDVEAAYLLGDFGVCCTGIYSVLTPPVKKIAFGDITRQGLPFYGGNLSYHLKAESRGGGMTLTASCYRGMLLKVRVDGEDRGAIVYSPYRLTIPNLKDGVHDIDLIYFGCRINTFGQLHANVRDPGHYWGANSWRSVGPAWTYEYRFWPQGVMKSPEVF
ncbi:MAG: hypothetical protein LBL70_08920 [Treponema sp.]|jgi:hypothetical protein|nr:hypothetical protein [Treponema sp.]